jgi:hypothetical protein
MFFWLVLDFVLVVFLDVVGVVGLVVETTVDFFAVVVLGLEVVLTVVVLDVVGRLQGCCRSCGRYCHGRFVSGRRAYGGTPGGFGCCRCLGSCRWRLVGGRRNCCWFLGCLGLLFLSSSNNNAPHYDELPKETWNRLKLKREMSIQLTTATTRPTATTKTKIGSDFIFYLGDCRGL